MAGKAPAGGGPPNTLYNTAPNGRSGNGVAYRIYVPDAGTGQFGGVPAPAITSVSADGERTPPPLCSAPPSDAAVSHALAQAGPMAWGLPDLGLLAPHPVWHEYVNAPNGYLISLTENEYTPPALESDLSWVALRSCCPPGLERTTTTSTCSQTFRRSSEK